MKTFLLLFALIFSYTSQAQNGTLDASFNSTGKIDSDHKTANDICTDKDNKVLVLGHENTGNRHIFVNRYLANGTLDNTFASGGEFIHDLNADWDHGRCIRALDNGKYMICGQNSVGSHYRIFIARLNNDGTPDSSFGDNGFTALDLGANLPWGEGNADAMSFEVSASGAAYVAGYRWDANSQGEVGCVWKFTPDGRLDTFFGNKGERTVPVAGMKGKLLGLDLSPGFITAAGNVWENGSNQGLVAMLDTNGNLVQSFNDSGYKIISYVVGEVHLYDIVHTYERLVMAGSYTLSGEKRAAAFALLPDGSIDTAFGTIGAYIREGDITSEYSRILRNCENEYFLGGSVGENGSSSFSVTKLSYEGAPDLQFGSDGHFSARVLSSGNEYAEAMCFWGSKGVMVAGRTKFEGGYKSRSGIVRIAVEECGTTSVNPAKSENLQVLLYPNPCSSGEEVYIAVTGMNTSGTLVTVFDNTGKRLYSETYPEGDSLLRLAVANLPAGVYTVLVKGNSGSTTGKLLMLH